MKAMNKLTNIQKENIVDHIMNNQIRCKRCSKYDGDRSDKADKQDVNYHCTVDTYDGRCWFYCFSEIYNYIENNNLWEVMIKKHRIKKF